VLFSFSLLTFLLLLCIYSIFLYHTSGLMTFESKKVLLNDMLYLLTELFMNISKVMEASEIRTLMLLNLSRRTLVVDVLYKQRHIPAPQRNHSILVSCRIEGPL
jgi:hypothetical protein